jgi:DNA-binding beta-propeller fold protein YncE
MKVSSSISRLVSAGAVLAGIASPAATVGPAAAVQSGGQQAGPANVQVRIIALPPGCGPGSVAVDPHKRAVWVNCVVRISEQTQRVTKRFPFAAEAVAVDPRLGVVWAADNANGTLMEISEATNKVIHRFSGLLDPTSVAVDQRTRTVWVTSSNVVLVFSEVTHRLLHTVRLGLNQFQRPWDLNIDSRAGMVWVAIRPTTDRRTPRTFVAQISEATRKVIRTYPYSSRDGIAITAIDPARGIVWMEVGNAISPATVRVISESRHRVVRTFTNLPIAPNGLAIDSRTSTVLAAGIRNYFKVLSEKTGKVTRTIRMRYASDVAVDENTGNVYALSYVLTNPRVVQFRL